MDIQEFEGLMQKHLNFNRDMEARRLKEEKTFIYLTLVAVVLQIVTVMILRTL